MERREFIKASLGGYAGGLAGSPQGRRRGLSPRDQDARKLAGYSLPQLRDVYWHYHHPRHLMLNLLSLERMIRRGGRTPDKLL